MTDHVPIPRQDYRWAEALGNIPKDQAVQLHFNRRYNATRAGESARHYAKQYGLGKLHTHIVGGALDPISGSYLDTECNVTLTLWL